MKNRNFFSLTTMLKESIIRARIREVAPNFPTHLIARSVSRIQQFAFHERDLTRSALEGALFAVWKHSATTYEKDLRSFNKFGGNRQELNDDLRSRFYSSFLRK